MLFHKLGHPSEECPTRSLSSDERHSRQCYMLSVCLANDKRDDQSLQTGKMNGMTCCKHRQQESRLSSPTASCVNADSVEKKHNYRCI